MNLSPALRQRFFDQNGLPLSGGQLFSYQAGTSTPQATFSNAGGATNTNPVVLDSSGYADVWLDPTLAYKFILQDAGSSTLWTEDNVTFAVGVSIWTANSIYGQGALVQDSSGQGLLYVSLTSNNQGNALTIVSAWRVFGGNVRTVSVNTTLTVTDDLVRSNSTSGNLTHTLPPCATTPIGKEITIKDVGTTGGNTTSVKGSGTDTIDGAITYGTALGQYAQLQAKNNGTSWDVISLPNNSVTTAKLVDGAVTQAKRVAAPMQISSGTGNAAVNYTALTDVAGLSTPSQIYTGRPVLLALINDAPNMGGLASTISCATAASATGDALLYFYRDTTLIGAYHFGLFLPSGAARTTSFAPMVHLDYNPSAGAHTYKIALYGDPSNVLNAYNLKLIAVEL